jgi:hypothetical protein
MTLYRVTKRQIQDQSFYVDVDHDLSVEEVITRGAKEHEQLDALLLKANCRNEANKCVTKTSWSLAVPSPDDGQARVLVGTLELVKKFYAKVQFKVTHAITRLVEVQAPSRRAAAEILGRNIDDDMHDILIQLNDDLLDDNHVEESDCDVIEWGSDPENLTDSYPHPVKVYTEED